jgi:hypothetical protein
MRRPHYNEKIMTTTNKKLFALVLSAIIAGGSPLMAQSVQWTRTFGWSGDERAYDIQQIGNGGYIVGGVSFAGFYAVLLTSSGDTVWTRTYAFGNGAYLTQEIQGGDFLLAGFKLNSPWGQDASFARISATGDVVWSKLYGGIYDQQVNAAAITADNGCIAVGQNITGAFGMTGILAFRIAANGDSLWMDDFPGSGADNAFDVVTTGDGGCIIAGSYGTNNNDAYFIRLDAGGNVVWTKQYGTPTGNEKAYCVVQTPDAGFLAGGVTSTGGILYKLNPSGDTLWTRSLSLGPYDIRVATGGQYIIAGQLNLDAALTLVDSLGTPIWTKTYGGSQSEQARSAQQTSDGGFVLAGSTTSFGAGGADFYVVKTDSLGQAVSVGTGHAPTPVEARLEQNYPNPFNPVTVINYAIAGGKEYGVGSMETKLVVYDLLGREVATLVNEEKAPGRYEVTFDASALASGVYIYRLNAAQYVECRKMVVMR